MKRREASGSSDQPGGAGSYLSLDFNLRSSIRTHQYRTGYPRLDQKVARIAPPTLSQSSFSLLIDTLNECSYIIQTPGEGWLKMNFSSLPAEHYIEAAGCEDDEWCCKPQVLVCI